MSNGDNFDFTGYLNHILPGWDAPKDPAGGGLAGGVTSVPAPAPAGDLPILDISKDPDKNQSLVMDARWKDVERRFMPIEDQLFAMLRENPEAQIDAMGDSVAKQYASSQRDLRTDLQRSWQDPNSEMANSLARVSLLNRARDIATAENTGRRALSENRMNMLGDLMGIGRGIAGSSQDSLSSAASSQAAREQIGKQTASGKTAGILGSAASGAALGWTIGGGPIGAAIGGGLGLLAGLF